jgi:hypothetical protein
MFRESIDPKDLGEIPAVIFMLARAHFERPLYSEFSEFHARSESMLLLRLANRRSGEKEFTV